MSMSRSMNMDSNDPGIQSRLNAELLAAVGNVDLEAVNQAIEAGADCNCVYEDGAAPIHLAVNKKNVEIVRALLEHGADANAVNRQGWGAIHYAVLSSSGDLEVIQALLEHGCDVNSTTVQGRSTLNLAAAFDYERLCQFLLEEGADVNAKDDEGRSALMESCAQGHLTSVLVLLAYGANKDRSKSDSVGVFRALQMNALQAAVASRLGGKVVELLDAGMDATDRGTYPKSAIELAEEFGFQNIVSIINAHAGRKLARSLINGIEPGPEAESEPGSRSASSVRHAG